MKKFKFWLVQFVVEIDSTPISHMVVVEVSEFVSATTCALLLDRLQGTLFSHWPEIPQDATEPCANGGTHRKTEWLCARGGKAVTVCVHWTFKQGVSRAMAKKLRQAGAEWKKLSI